MAVEERDPHSGFLTTGHEWSGIKELNTPVPRAVYFFLLATFVFSLGYWLLMPAWPTGASFTKGLLGADDRKNIARSLEQAEQARAWSKKIEAADFAAIQADPALMTIVRQSGRTLFGDNCAACHGVGGAGAKGYPNLNDDDWLWGGSFAEIQKTLEHGIRFAGDPDTRVSQMPAFGREKMLDAAQIRAVANHVRSIAGLPTEAKADLAGGAKIYADNCAACHGDQGKGNREMGAPDLTDAISLYGMDLASLTETIANSRNGVMPGWNQRLDATTIKALTVYVHSLGGGQ